ncbi:MAG: hypothetical protein RIA62_17380 [Cyclobacteriaceae bacterium]
MIITDTSLHIEQLKKHFNHRDRFSVSDIKEFYRRFDDSIKRTTIDWRIHELKNKGILQKVGRGQYSFKAGKTYLPFISRSEKNLYNKVKKEFPFLNICVWNSKWLNEFMVHQPGRFYTMVEVEKDTMQSVFYFLQGKMKQVFLDPPASVLEQYVQENEVIIVSNLVTEAPTQKVENINTATLEKMLVDIYCDDVIFSAQQGEEMNAIFWAAFDKYLVDQTKMFRYASRRRKRDELKLFVEQLLPTGK